MEQSAPIDFEQCSTLGYLDVVFNSQNKEDTILITQTRNEIMNQFEILKSQGFDAYKKYVDSKKEEQKKTLTKREYYEWLHIVNENLKSIPYTTEVVHHYDLANVPDEIKEAISYVCAGHGINLASESLVTGIYHQV